MSDASGVARPTRQEKPFFSKIITFSNSCLQQKNNSIIAVMMDDWISQSLDPLIGVCTEQNGFIGLNCLFDTDGDSTILSIHSLVSSHRQKLKSNVNRESGPAMSPLRVDDFHGHRFVRVGNCLRNDGNLSKAFSIMWQPLPFPANLSWLWHVRFIISQCRVAGTLHGRLRTAGHLEKFRQSNSVLCLQPQSRWDHHLDVTIIHRKPWGQKAQELQRRSKVSNVRLSWQ